MTVGKLGTRQYLAGASAVLALTFTSLGLSAGLPSTADTARSVASQATSTPSGACSKAEATVVVKRLHLGEADYMPNPVFGVVCGSFMGPGSKTMVVSLASGGTSVPFEGWGVFRLAGDTWQLVKRPGNGAQVSAAGSDIREPVSILRPGTHAVARLAGRGHASGTGTARGLLRAVGSRLCPQTRLRLRANSRRQPPDAVRQHPMRLWLWRQRTRVCPLRNQKRAQAAAAEPGSWMRPEAMGRDRSDGRGGPRAVDMSR